MNDKRTFEGEKPKNGDEGVGPREDPGSDSHPEARV